MYPGSLRHKKKLSPVEFLVLFGLNGRNLSGYALMESIAEETSGRIRLKGGTLYPALKRLSKRDLVYYDNEVKEYALTEAGRNFRAKFPEQLDSAFEASEKYIAFIVKRGGPKHFKAVCDQAMAKKHPWAFSWLCGMGNIINDYEESKKDHIKRLKRLREHLTKRIEKLDHQIEELNRGTENEET